MEVKEMSTQEAIEFCVEIKEYFNNDKGNQIIALLQQGEKDKEELKKVWQMWEAVEKLNRYNLFNMKIHLDIIKQKYFPKFEV